MSDGLKKEMQLRRRRTHEEGYDCLMKDSGPIARILCGMAEKPVADTASSMLPPGRSPVEATRLASSQQFKFETASQLHHSVSRQLLVKLGSAVLFQATGCWAVYHTNDGSQKMRIRAKKTGDSDVVHNGSGRAARNITTATEFPESQLS